MVADQTHESAGNGMDQPAHVRNYDGFIRVLKVSTIVVAIVTAIVVLIISS